MDIPKRAWKLEIQEPNGSTVLDEIEALLQVMRLDAIAPGRHSSLFALSAFGLFKAGMLNPFRLATELQALERGEFNGLKAPVQNRHPPLKGLWHKHFMQVGLSRWR